jgi:peptidoglycan hydrolase CwlO-like protein
MPLVRPTGSRALAAALVAAVCVASLAILAPAAHAQSASDASELKADADAASSRYFATLQRVQDLDDELVQNEREVDELGARAKEARDAARARALLAYTSSGTTQLATLIDGNDTLDTARRAQLIDRVNAHDQDVFDELSEATAALRKQQRTLKETRQAQADALDELKAQGAAIDAKLAAAEATQQQAKAAAAAQAAASTSASPAAGTAADPTTAAPSTTGAPATVPAAPVAPPDYSGTPGSSSHHDDPFLSCVRQRESSGNYGAVNPSGPYLGAYQFLQSTWNVTAAHAGRGDLVGVPANLASPADQDEMAWTLYQWQGAGPWGGGC